MIFAQIGQIPTDMFDHGIAVSAVAFVGWFIIYVMKRTIGENGIWTQSNKNAMESLNVNTQTLLEIKDIIQHQQENCTKHSAAMEHVCAAEEEMAKSLRDAITEAAASRDRIEKRVAAVHEHAATWGDHNPLEFRSPPVLDALLDIIKTTEVVLSKNGQDCETEFRDLRDGIAEINSRMQEVGP